VSRASVAANDPDLSPAVAKLLDAGADCITLNTTPNMVVQALTAIHQTGEQPTVALVGAVFPKDARKSVGELGENVLSIENSVSPDEDTPVINQIKADMAKFDRSSQLSSFGIETWTSGRLIEAAVRTIDGPVNAQTLLAALNGLRDVAIPTIHNFSAIELPNPAFKRFFNHYLVNYRIHDTVPVRDGDFYDIAAALPK
jgi:ABC-type branched-subunit amino acid transport system substrate-binding protein